MKYNDLIELANNYFKIWNYHNLEKLKILFIEDSELRDWDTHVFGKDNVIEANKKIFENIPKIEAKIINLYPCETNNTVCCEIVIKLDNNNNIKVLDIIEYNTKGYIKSLRAYKG